MVHFSQLLGQPASFRKRKEFKMGAILGEGTFGIVRTAYWKKHDPPMTVAVKVIAKRLLKDNLDLVYQELEVLKHCNHPNIVKLYDDFESKDKFYMVMEQATGGDVFDRMIRRGFLTEAHATSVLRSITSAIAYLHERNIVHRDIKPDNVLYSSKAEDSEVVLVDFGVAQALNTKGELMSSLAGSFEYVAPEVLGDSQYGAEVDLWSLGVVAYVMITGYVPFKGKTPKELREIQLQHAAGFDDRYWGKLSPESKDFILSCLTIDWTKRLTAHQALNHPWLNTPNDDETNIVAGLRENYGRDKTSRPPMPLRGTRLVHVQRRGHDRHELESSDDEDDSIDEEDEEEEDETGAGRTAAETEAGTNAGAATAGAGAGAEAVTSQVHPVAQQSAATTPAPASVAASSAVPSTSVSRVPTPGGDVPSGPASRRTSLSRPDGTADKLGESEAEGPPSAPSSKLGEKGLISGLTSLVAGDKDSGQTSQTSQTSQTGHVRSLSNDSTGGLRKRFSLLRLSRSGSRVGSRMGSRSGSPRPDSRIKSSGQLDENALDDAEDDDAAPTRSS